MSRGPDSLQQCNVQVSVEVSSRQWISTECGRLQAGISHYTTAKYCSPNHIPTLTPNMNPVSVTGTCIYVHWQDNVHIHTYMYSVAGEVGGRDKTER